MVAIRAALSSVSKWAIVLCVVSFLYSAAASAEISLHALFANKAFLQVDSQRVVLELGQTSPVGIKLVEINDNSVVILRQGQRQVLSLTPLAAKEGDAGGVLFVRNHYGLYSADAQLNGYYTRTILDTGASAIFVNQEFADRVQLTYAKNRSRQVSTAGGKQEAYPLLLDELRLGSIAFTNLNAWVIDSSNTELYDLLLPLSLFDRYQVSLDGSKIAIGEK